MSKRYPTVADYPPAQRTYKEPANNKSLTRLRHELINWFARAYSAVESRCWFN